MKFSFLKRFFKQKVAGSKHFAPFLFLSTSLLILLLPVFFAKWLKTFKTLGFLGIFLISFFGSATVFVPSSAILTIGVGGSLYNPGLVALTSSLGSSLGEIVSYIFGYSSEKIINIKRYKRVYKIFSILFDKSKGVAVFVFAFVPNPFFDLVGIFAGISRFSIRKFLIIVFLARFLRDLLIASTGAYLVSY